MHIKPTVNFPQSQTYEQISHNEHVMAVHFSNLSNHWIFREGYSHGQKKYIFVDSLEEGGLLLWIL